MKDSGIYLAIKIGFIKIKIILQEKINKIRFKDNLYVSKTKAKLILINKLVIGGFMV